LVLPSFAGAGFAVCLACPAAFAPVESGGVSAPFVLLPLGLLELAEDTCSCVVPLALFKGAEGAPFVGLESTLFCCCGKAPFVDVGAVSPVCCVPLLFCGMEGACCDIAVFARTDFSCCGAVPLLEGAEGVFACCCTTALFACPVAVCFCAAPPTFV
jgi:hypothetical protein